MDEQIYEPEGGEKKPVDAVWVLDGRGRAVALEVADDEDD